LPPQRPKRKTPTALQALDDVDPDAMSPREALEVLYRLKVLRQGGEGG
jgi:hypothetical protein